MYFYAAVANLQVILLFMRISPLTFLSSNKWKKSWTQRGKATMAMCTRLEAPVSNQIPFICCPPKKRNNQPYFSLLWFTYTFAQRLKRLWQRNSQARSPRWLLTMWFWPAGHQAHSRLPSKLFAIPATIFCSHGPAFHCIRPYASMWALNINTTTFR